MPATDANSAFSGGRLMSFHRWGIVASALVASAPTAHAGYYYTPIDPPGSISTQAQGLNDNGVVVGSYSDSGGTSYGFVDNSGAYTQLAPTPASGCGAFAGDCNVAWGVNNSGAVVGSFYTTTGPTINDGAEHGFLYTNGNYSTFTQLDVPGAESTAAYGISNDGIVVGQAIESSGDLGFTYDISTQQYATFTLRGLPTGASFIPFGINDAGEVVGTYSNPGDEFSVFLYTLGASSFTILPENPAAAVGPFEGTFGTGINDLGDLAGTYTVDGSLGFGALPFAYLLGQYVNFSVGLPSDPFVDNSGADGINNLGDIVGVYSSAPDGEFGGFLATPAPEPSAWVMMLLGFVGLGFVSLRGSAALLRA
jgi:hypothetical protein